MAISYETTERLFNAGKFLDIRRELPTGDSLRRLPVPHQLLLAHALALTGETLLATQVCRNLDVASSSPLLKSQFHFALGIVNENSGATPDALAHFQTALRWAIASGDDEQIAWSHVRILRHVIDRGASELFAPALRDARQSVTRAASVHITVFLHQCVAVLEGQSGRFDEALRHCDIADSLLAAAPNIWLQGANEVNRGCLALLNCQYEIAAQYLVDAQLSRARSGIQSGAAESTLAQCYILTGRYKKATEILERIVRSDKTSRLALLGALEGMARLHLAQNQFIECESVLRTIRNYSDTNPAIVNSFHTRWATVTEIRFLLKSGQLVRATELIAAAKRQFAALCDTPLSVALMLSDAQASSRSADLKSAAHSLLEASRLGATSIRDLQAAYYFASAASLDDSDPLGDQLRHRADALWKAQRVVSVPVEMGRSPVLGRRHTPSTSGMVVEAIAAAFDVAYEPRLLGQELLNLVVATGCASEAELAEPPSSLENRIQIQNGRCWIPVGHGESRLALALSTPADPQKAVTVAALARIASAALSLEDSRAEERERAAIWPAEPAETTTGALFLAEEMRALLATARRVATTTAPVLITGETGTGKEVLARAIHASSPRAKATFLPFNCTSTPRDMVDSQLFGHRRGSFTGALENFQGVIRGAAGGTLFLDEIGDMSLDVQPKLLRFLESAEVHPVGETQPVRVDVRVIAATNANLDSLVAEGRFREDLFYRLNIVRLHIPPLRERRTEIPPLANHYLQKYAAEYAKGHLRLAEETMEYLVLYAWPGNVRQLANEMRRMAALCEAGAVVMPEHLSTAIASSRRTIPASERTLEPTEVVVRLDQPMAAATEHLHRAMVQYALKQCGGRMEETAAKLGLSRKGLYLKRQRFGIEPPESATVAV